MESLNLEAAADRLIARAMNLRTERDHMGDALRDLIAGAEMVMPHFSGAALSYVREVKRVAEAGLAVRS